MSGRIGYTIHEKTGTLPQLISRILSGIVNLRSTFGVRPISVLPSIQCLCIRHPAKYEHKRFMDRSATVAAHLGPSQSKASLAATGGLLVRPKTAPLKSSSPDPGPSKSTQPSPAAPSPSTSGLTVPKREHRSASATLPESPALSFVSNPQTQRPATATQPFTTMLSGAFSTGLTPPVRSNTFAAPMQNQIPSFASPVFNDLFTLQGPAPATNSTLPLQYQSPIGVNTPPTPFSQTHAMGGFGGAPAPVSQPTGVPFGGLGSTSLPSGNPYANLTANGMGISPGFQPGLRSASFPVFSTQPTGMGLGQPTPTNPYQFALQPTAVNPYGAVQPTQSYSPVPFQPSYSPQPTPPPFTQQATVPSQSPSFFPNFGTYTPQPQQQPAPVFNTQSGTPMSHHAQQAQQLFQNMQGGNNPFSSQNWA